MIGFRVTTLSPAYKVSGEFLMAPESSPLYAPFRPRWRGRHGWGVMAGSEATADFVQELLNLSPGRVRCFLDADFDGVRQSLESEKPALRLPIVLLKRIEAIPAATQIINDVIQAMAATARNLWPVWFTDVDFGLGRSSADRVAVRLRLEKLRAVPGLSPIWGLGH